MCGVVQTSTFVSPWIIAEGRRRDARRLAALAPVALDWAAVAVAAFAFVAAGATVWLG